MHAHVRMRTACGLCAIERTMLLIEGWLNVCRLRREADDLHIVNEDVFSLANKKNMGTASLYREDQTT
eukprot:6208704-Pleurochrysis_carterae.AAC.2